MMVFARNALLAFLVLLNSVPASAQTKIRYLLTSPSPNVAEATHSSVPEALGYWKDAGLDVTVTPFNGGTGATQLVGVNLCPGVMDYTDNINETLPQLRGAAQNQVIEGVDLGGLDTNEVAPAR